MDAVKQLLSAAGGTALTLRPDWFVLTDGTAESFPRLVGDAALADSGKVKVFIDHETPLRQRKVRQPPARAHQLRRPARL